MVRYKGNLSAEYIEEDKYSDKTLWSFVSRKHAKTLVILLIIAALLFTALMIKSAYAHEASKDEIAEMIRMSVVLNPWEDTQVIFADKSFPLTPNNGFIVFIGRRIPGAGLTFYGEVIKE